MRGRLTVLLAVLALLAALAVVAAAAPAGTDPTDAATRATHGVAAGPPGPAVRRHRPRVPPPGRGARPLTPQDAPVDESGPLGGEGAALGIAAGGSLQYASDAEREAHLDAYVAAQARWLRFDVHWSTVQAAGPDSYDWEAHDAVVDGARARGIRVLGVIAYTPSWASGHADDKYPPRDPADYGRFCGATAERYASRGVHHWEVWNEPNLAGFWKPASDVTHYAALLRACYDAIHAVDPQAVVVSGGTSPAVDNGGDIEPRTWLKGLYAAGGGGSFDALGHHPYTWPNTTAEESQWSAWWIMGRAPESLRSIMVAHGDGGKRIWATEFGAPTNVMGEAGQDNLLRTAWNEWRAAPWAGPMIWYQLIDEGTDAGDFNEWYGLLRADWSPKPAHAVFRAASTGAL